MTIKAIWNSVVVAESDDTVVVEGNHYFPRESLVEQHFTRSKTRSVCPWKGLASYYTITVDGAVNRDAAWVYPPLAVSPQDQGTGRVLARRRCCRRLRPLRGEGHPMTAETLETTVDVVVIGMGVAGEAVAGDLAASGLDVIGVESHLVGGECPYWGCIPTKMMVRAAGLIAEIRRVEGLAGTATVSPDWAQVAQRIRDEATDDWDDQVAVDRFTAKGGHFLRSRARLAGPRPSPRPAENGPVPANRPLA